MTQNGELDREQNDIVILQVTATDNGVPPLTSTVSIYVGILDFNDNDPEFVLEPNNYHFNISENVSVGHQVHQMNATDKDEGLNAEISYTIQQNGDTFRINETTVCVILIIVHVNLSTS